MSRYKKPLALRPEPGGRVPDVAMVMAAGLGKRMRPLTATRPKPLVQVAGRALIDHALDRLAAAGVKKAVVNVHYLADSVEAHLASRGGPLETIVSDEREQLLETGGGLKRALPLIDADPFLAVNSDNLWIDGPVDTLRLLASGWDDKKMDALLLLVPLANAHCHLGRGDFHMKADGRLSRRRPRGASADGRDLVHGARAARRRRAERDSRRQELRLAAREPRPHLPRALASENGADT